MAKKNMLRATLRRLEQFPTLSAFSRLFYRLIYDQISQGQFRAPKLEQAFYVFLRCEYRRHRAAVRIARRGKLGPREMARVNHVAEESLKRLMRAVAPMECPDRDEASTREMVLAECAYQLGQTEAVIYHLDKGIKLGMKHPLVHFALGYNLYAQAMQRFTKAGPHKGELVARDFDSLKTACDQAIGAFEKGLGNESYDAQIHWWVGMIHEMLGDKERAGEAYRQAMTIDPEHFSQQVVDKLRGLGQPWPVVRTAAENSRLSKLTPITDRDILEARAFLDECEAFPTFFCDEGESGRR